MYNDIVHGGMLSIKKVLWLLFMTDYFFQRFRGRGTLLFKEGLPFMWKTECYYTS